MEQLHASPTTFRRRRILWLLVLFLILLYSFSQWTSSTPSVPGGFRLSRVFGYTKSLEDVKVDEIYGLIHLVTSEDGGSLQGIDTSTPIDLALYARQEATDWQQEVASMNKRYPIVVFSKTYCPYSKKAKQLLSTYQLHPPPKIIEVDRRDDSLEVKILLSRLTHQNTFPNIIVNGKSIGGSDKLQVLHEQGGLRPILENAGAVVEE